VIPLTLCSISDRISTFSNQFNSFIFKFWDISSTHKVLSYAKRIEDICRGEWWLFRYPIEHNKYQHEVGSGYREKKDRSEQLLCFQDIQLITGFCVEYFNKQIFYYAQILG